MPYDAHYESRSVRGTEAPRPWDIIEVIRNHARQSDVLLDIGCGTGSKIISLVSDVKTIYGIEPSEGMQQRAKENGRTSFIHYVAGKAEFLPFQDNCFDMVTCMVAPHNIAEIARVLKPGGYAILEKIGEQDKRNIKQEFGRDHLGARGQFCDERPGTRALRYVREAQHHFSDISVLEGMWETYLTRDGLLHILEQTPSVRNFDKEKDRPTLDRIVQKYQASLGIWTMQQRVLLVARK